MIRMNVPPTGALFARLAIQETQCLPLLNRARHNLEPLHIGGLRREGPERQNLFAILKRIPLLVVQLARQLPKRHLEWLVKWRPAVLLDRLVRDQQREHFRLSDGWHARKPPYFA